MAGGWKKPASVALALALALVAVAVLVPTIEATDVGEPLQSDSNVVAHVVATFSRFPRPSAQSVVEPTHPVSFVHDSKGRMFIADSWERQVIVVNANNEVEHIIGSSRDATIYAPWLGIPWDIAIDSRDTIYICTLNSQSIHILSPDLTCLGNIEISHPDPGGPRSLPVHLEDRLLVGDYRVSGDSRILIFAPDPSDRAGASMILEGEFCFSPPGDKICGIPEDIAVDSEGRIIVAEGSTQILPNRDRISIFDKDFAWVATLGSSGSGPRQFLALSSVEVSPSDAIVALDGLTNTLSYFLRDGTYAGTVEQGGAPGSRGLRTTVSGSILAGRWKESLIREIALDWDTLRPVEVAPVGPPGPAPEPPFPVLEVPYMIAVGFLGFLRCKIRSC